MGKIAKAREIAVRSLLVGLLIVLATCKAPKAEPADPCNIDIPVLMYHFFDASGQGDEYTQPISILEEQMNFLAEHGWHTVLPDDLVSAAEKIKPLPAKAVMLTFDDWDPSQYDLAMPILDRHGFKGVFFVITGGLDDAQAERIRDAAARGHVIGSHSVSHFRLTNKVCLGPDSHCCHDYRSCSEDEIRRELADSKLALEKIVGKPVTSFAWPWGSYNRRSVEIAREVGYTTMFTASPGVTHRPYYIYRIGCGCTGEALAESLRDRDYCARTDQPAGRLYKIRWDLVKAVGRAREP